MNKKLISLVIGVSLFSSLIGCSKQSSETAKADSTSTAVANAAILSSINVSSGESETVGAANTFIELGSTTTITGSGATVEKNKITITAAGIYSIKGTLTDGQIIVNAGDEDKVYIILNGVNITCSNSAPIYIKNSKKTVISLADNTKNYVKDGASYVFEDKSNEEPNAAIYSKDELTFIGKGSLDVSANYKNGITSKDDLKIENGIITVNSKEDGLLGKDSVVVTNGTITINAGADGIKSTNAEDSKKGYVLIEGGKFNITSAQDGIQAEINALVKNGDITINSGGGSKNAVTKREEMNQPGMRQGANSQNTNTTNSSNNTNTTNTAQSEESTSAKAIKAGVNIVTEGGTFKIDSSDDAMHSNNNLVINNGAFNIATGDDAFHSDSTLTINKGTIDISKSYEGIEGETITINGGNINLTSSDDGLNASGGNDSSGNTGDFDKNNTSQNSGKPGAESADNGLININGGYITVNAGGDGVDSNGSINMKDGTVIVNGPTNDGNGALDYNGTFEIKGGTLIAAGSSGMAQAPSTSSTANSIKINLSSQTANTLVHIENEAGENILTFAPSKEYSSVVVTSPNIKTGSTYKVYLGGSSTGTAKNGVYSNGTYTKGKEIGSVKISSTVSELTQEGVTVNTRGGGGGQGGPMGPRGQGQDQGAPNGMQPPQK